MKKIKIYVPNNDYADILFKNGGLSVNTNKSYSREDIHTIIERKARSIGLLTVSYIILRENAKIAAYIFFTGTGNFFWTTDKDVFDCWDAEIYEWKAFNKLLPDDIR